MEKVFNARELTRVGCTRRKDLDFSDDGAKFTCYEYKGVRISYHKYNGDYYIALRIDEVPGLKYSEYSKIPNYYNLANEFNGCENPNAEKIIQNIDTLLEGIKELQTKMLNHVVDIEKLNNRINIEINMVTEIINNFKNKFDVLGDYELYELEKVIKYSRSLTETIKEKQIIDLRKMEQADLRELENCLNTHGFVYFEEDDYYLEKIRNFTNKSNNL